MQIESVATIAGTSLYEVPGHYTREQKIEHLLPIARLFRATVAANPGLTTFASLDAEDIYVIAACAIVKAVDTYDAARSAKLSTYAMNKARWAIQDALRTCSLNSRSMLAQGNAVTWLLVGSESESGEGDLLERTFHDNGSDVLQLVLQREERERLYRYVNLLPEPDRSAVCIYLTESCSLREVGERMAMGEKRIYHLMNRAIEQLRKFHRCETFREHCARLCPA